VGHYEERFSVRVTATIFNRTFYADAPSTCEVRAGDDGFIVETRFGPVSAHDEHGDVSVPSEFVGLERITMQQVVDAQNRVVRGPTPSGSGPSETFLGELAEMMRNMRVTYSERPVRIGERWEGARVVWDTSPMAMVILEWQPTFTLEHVEDRVAEIRWDADLLIQPFTVMGISIEGRGEIAGVSRIELADGFAGRTELDLSVGVRPAGGGIAPFTVHAKYVDEVRRLP
jgi:hypothetical protein